MGEPHPAAASQRRERLDFSQFKRQTTMANLIRLSLVAGICLMFAQTLGSVFALAQTLDRVTAEKVTILAEMR